MSSRDKILAAVKSAQPSLIPLPQTYVSSRGGSVENFTAVLESIGGKVYKVDGMNSVGEEVLKRFPETKRIVSSITSVEQYFLREHGDLKHHSLHDVDVAIIEAQFGVAENGAVWITEDDSKIRVLPFIPEHLVVVLKSSDILPTMHAAYERIGNSEYGFGAFVAGPSKTADIEQSLVLGAHGPKSMTVLIVE